MFRLVAAVLLLTSGAAAAQPHVYIHSVCGQIVLATGETMEGSWWMTPQAYQADPEAQELVAESVAQADPNLLISFDHTEMLQNLFGFQCPKAL